MLQLCRRRDRRDPLERHPDVVHRSHPRYRHLVRHRILGVQHHRRNHLGDPDLQHRLDVGHLDDPVRRHQLDEDHLGDQRHPGLVDPCPVKERTGCCPDEPSGVEYPCPVRMRTGCCPDVEYLEPNPVWSALRLIQRQELPVR